MARLSLILLGGFGVRLDGDRAIGVPLKKAQALLAYLAIPHGNAHPREKLAALLWGDMGPSQARRGLRQSLSALKKILGDTSPFRLEGETVALDPAIVRVDAQEFEQCVSRGTADALDRAATLYQGDLLEGLAVPEPPFEEWLMTQRSRLRELALEALARLLATQRDARAREAAVRTAIRLVALDPLQEPVHRVLMRLYAELGQREAALRQYQVCVGALQRELRAEPDEETRALYREIVQRRLAHVPAPTKPSSAPPPAPSEFVVPAGPTPSEFRLVGREAELAQLRDALQAAWGGQGKVAALIGESGIGKSRLVAELAVEAGRNGGRVLVGRCYESEQVLPFGPWVHALRTARLIEEDEVGGQLAPAWRAELARLLPEIGEPAPAGPASDPGRLFEAIARLLERAASVRPVVLILEDVHWADETSLRLLAFLGRRLRPRPVLTVVTAREEDLSSLAVLRHVLDELAQGDGLTRVPLSPLSREATLALAGTLIPPPEAADLEARLWRASEGNPFVLVETLRTLRGRSARKASVGLPLPERVRRLIADRIERLGERNGALVAVAAVIGRPFEFALLERAAALGEAEAADGVEELVRHRVLYGSEEGFAFTHDRIREAVYGQLLPPRRQLLHRRVAEALESLPTGEPGSQALALGTHYRKGGVWAEAARHLTRAGTQAFLHYAQRDAVVCYEHALDALAELPESRETREQGMDLRFNVGYALFSLGRFERAKECFGEAETLALALDDYRRLGHIHAAMSHLLGSEGAFAGATQAGLRALTIATSLSDAPLQFWTSVGLGRVYYAQGDYRRSVDYMRQVLDLLKDVSLDERFVQISVLPSVACRTWLALGLARMGEFDEALARADEAARIAEAVDALRERIWAGYSLAFVHLGRGDGDQAMPLLEQAVSLCREGRFPIYSALIRASLGSAYAMSGRRAQALPLLEEAVAEAEKVKQVFGYPLVLIQTGAVHLEAGQLAEADRYASTALVLTRRHGGRGDEASTLHLLGEVAARRDPQDVGQALDRFVEALALAEELGMAPLQARCRLSLGRLRLQAGQAEAARAQLSRAVEMLGRMRMRYWLRATETLLANA